MKRVLAIKITALVTNHSAWPHWSPVEAPYCWSPLGKHSSYIKRVRYSWESPPYLYPLKGSVLHILFLLQVFIHFPECRQSWNMRQLIRPTENQNLSRRMEDSYHHTLLPFDISSPAQTSGREIERPWLWVRIFFLASVAESQPLLAEYLMIFRKSQYRGSTGTTIEREKIKQNLNNFLPFHIHVSLEVMLFLLNIAMWKSNLKFCNGHNHKLQSCVSKIWREKNMGTKLKFLWRCDKKIIWK